MTIYQVSFAGDPDGHKGYEYAPSKREAARIKREWDGDDATKGYRSPMSRSAEITPLEIEPSKVGIIRALNRYAGHPDNG